jgi:hypothetical protein
VAWIDHRAELLPRVGRRQLEQRVEIGVDAAVVHTQGGLGGRGRGRRLGGLFDASQRGRRRGPLGSAAGRG